MFGVEPLYLIQHEPLIHDSERQPLTLPGSTRVGISGTAPCPPDQVVRRELLPPASFLANRKGVCIRIDSAAKRATAQYVHPAAHEKIVLGVRGKTVAFRDFGWWPGLL